MGRAQKLQYLTYMNQRSGDDDTSAKLFKDGKDVSARMDVCETDQENGPEDSYDQVSSAFEGKKSKILYRSNLSQA